MLLSTHFLVAALALVSNAAISVASYRAANTATGAAYLITNDPSENKVLAITIGSDGHLGPTIRAFSTGGHGSHGIDNPPPNGVDPLFSQGSVAVNSKARLLVTVNAGSNTVTLFSINPEDPTRLTLLGKPVPSGGEFPQSVTINSKGTEVCVLNGGKVNGVNCFATHPIFGLIQRPDTLRLLGRNQTTPPTGPPNTLGQVIFSPDDLRLIASVKGDPSTPGFLATWSISYDGSLSSTFAKSTPASGGALPFSLTPIPGSDAILSADPAIGFEIYDFGGSNGGNVATSHVTAIAGQAAVCWSTFSARSGNFYVIDVVTDKVSEVHVERNLNASLVQQYQLPTGSGTIDSQVASIGSNDFLYVLSASTAEINVLNVNIPEKATSVQTFAFTSGAKEAGASITNINLQGLATYIKN